MWISQKIIPSARKNAPPDVWQLVSWVNIDRVTNELWNCTAMLELRTGPQDPYRRPAQGSRFIFRSRA
jgi:hypothetical protein